MTVTIDLMGIAATTMVAISAVLFFFFPALAMLALWKNNQSIDTLLDWIAYKGTWVYAGTAFLCVTIAAFSVFGKTVTPETQTHVDTMFKHLIANSIWFSLYTIAARIHDRKIETS